MHFDTIKSEENLYFVPTFGNKILGGVTMNTNPCIGFLRTVLLYLTGRVRFIKSSIGKEFIIEYGKKFTVFRHVVIYTNKKKHIRPQAIFKIRFLPKDVTIEENKRFSRIPMLFFMGFHGFRSKYWMVDEITGLCQGVYEWETLQDAENYSKSIAVRFMTKRSIPGSVNFEIINQTKRILDIK